MKEIKISDRPVGDSHPVYFIADIAANHDGDLERAKMLIRLAKEAQKQRNSRTSARRISFRIMVSRPWAVSYPIRPSGRNPCSRFTKTPPSPGIGHPS